MIGFSAPRASRVALGASFGRIIREFITHFWGCNSNREVDTDTLRQGF